MTDLEQTDVRFGTTEWSLVRAAGGDADDERTKRALATLVERYWPAVYAALRRWGRGHEEARELTQGFFADVVLQRHLFQRAQAERGKLRTLVLTGLKRYLVDEHRRRTKRGDALTISLDALQREEELLAVNGQVSPEETFERRWAMAELQTALMRCESYFRDSGRDSHWELFEERVVRPVLTGSPRPGLADLCAKHGFVSVSAVGAAIQVVRKRALVLLREVIAEAATSREAAQEDFLMLTELLRRK